jgi:hypothetical protein
LEHWELGLIHPHWEVPPWVDSVEAKYLKHGGLDVRFGCREQRTQRVN